MVSDGLAILFLYDILSVCIYKDREIGEDHVREKDKKIREGGAYGEAQWNG